MAIPPWRCSSLYQGKKERQKRCAVWMAEEAVGRDHAARPRATAGLRAD